MAGFRELGATGLKRYGGVVQEEYLSELRGDRWYKTVRRMMDDPIVAAVIFAIEMSLRQVSWQIKPKDATPEAQALAEFVDGCLDDMAFTWQDTLAEILTMLPYGWSLLEVVYKVRGGDSNNPKYKSKYDDGKIGWRKWAGRSQDTLSEWEFDNSGGVQAMFQAPGEGKGIVRIPIEKCLLFRTTTRKNNPEGRSVLRSAYRPWYFLTNIQNIEGIGIERDLAGLPVAWVPPSILSPDAGSEETAIFNSMQDMVVGIRRDAQEGLVFPLAYDEKGNKIYDITLLASGGNRQFATTEVIERYEQRIAMCVMADFLLIGHEKQGSFALSTSKTDMFITGLRSWLDSIADVITRYAIPRLLKVNGMDVSLSPVMVHGDVGRIDLEELGAFVERLSRSGFSMAGDELENYLRQQANLPLRSAEDASGDAEGDNNNAPGATQSKLVPVNDTPDDESVSGVESVNASIISAAAKLLREGL